MISLVSPLEGLGFLTGCLEKTKECLHDFFTVHVDFNRLQCVTITENAIEKLRLMYHPREQVKCARWIISVRSTAVYWDHPMGTRRQASRGWLHRKDRSSNQKMSSIQRRPGSCFLLLLQLVIVDLIARPPQKSCRKLPKVPPKSLWLAFVFRSTMVDSQRQFKTQLRLKLQHSHIQYQAPNH